MTPEQAQDLIRRMDRLEQTLGAFTLIDRYEFTKTLRHSGPKLSFFSKPPVAQQSAVTTPSGGGGAAADAVDQTARTAIGQIKTALQNLGLTA